MKKIIIGTITILAIATLIATKVNISSNTTKSDLSFKNTEALAGGESPGKRCTGPKENGECKCRNTAPCRDTSGC